MASVMLGQGQNLQTIYTFSNLTFTNGLYPEAPLTLGNDGNFYGSTYEGGTTNQDDNEGFGTIFKVTTNGTLTTLVSFSVTNGISPYAALTVGNDGNFYGTTEFGGSGGVGTIFRLMTNGTLTTLASFNGVNGEYPRAALTMGNDGNFYGTTTQGGSGNVGTMFKVTASGTLITLVSFGGIEYTPVAPLILGNDGNFYGTTAYTIFRATTNGEVTTLFSFPFSFNDGINGEYPAAALTLGNDGNFYGTTSAGGSDNNGTVFQVTHSGTLTTLVSFPDMPDSFDGQNAQSAESALTLGNDGNFYGTMLEGGSGGYGMIFQVSTNGMLTTLYSFNFNNGAFPNGLTLGNDGNLYGMTYQGGSGGFGTIFRLVLTPAINVQPQSQTANAGESVAFTCGAILPQVVFQWQRNGTNLANGGNISGATNSTLTIASISDSDAATYFVVVSNALGSVASSNAMLTVIDPPSIRAQPTNLLLLAGDEGVFSVAASDSTAMFQWRLNATNLLNATNAIYTIPSVRTNNAGNYSVLVSNLAGTVISSNAALTVVLSPTSQTNYASSTAAFTVTAIGPESLNYQWQENGTNLTNGGNISGATNSTLTIASLSDADAANYSAVVSDACSGVNTSSATLTVNDSLFFAAQPLSQTVRAGSMVTFTATAYGSPPFVFQWSFNQKPMGSPTSGTNVSSFTLANVATNQSGNYSVQVFNASGSLTSSNAVLTVIQPPTLDLQILAGYPVLSLYGTVGSNYMVQYNTNLAATNWLNLSLVNLSSTPYQFLDPSGVGQPARFYRAFFAQ